MRSVSEGDSSPMDEPGSSAKEERILVSVRFRPLNDRELSNNDAWDWECVDNTTIVPKNIPNERSMFPTSYTFDRVFGSDCSTRQVYEDAAKNVALSVVSGINASILAYGQTSSGKTYTMSRITEYTMLDIFDYVQKHKDRQFLLKFAAMEIYNECVRDLLSSYHTPLRVLDDPERGIVVDKLTEVTLKDWSQVIELLTICDAQRQVSETSLNEMSSRSHQILRLTVVNCARSYTESDDSRTLAATVNFVDLAGSERASQTMSAGAQLKEGGHINSSLLTLGTVIRRLSKGKNGHIPYRDSKLTRILQNSLGGNARTAIICTLSPAHSHVEQSRNTLLFASCAKKVSSSVKANVVTSDKALVKKLEKDLARMKNELRELGSLSDSSHSESNWKERELLIEQMAKEIQALTEQRDEAQSHLRLLLQSGGERSSLSGSSFDKGPWLDDYSSSEASEVVDNIRSDMVYNKSHSINRYGWFLNNFDEVEWDDQLISDETPRVFIEKYFGPDPTHGWENVISISDRNIEDGVVEMKCYGVEDIGKGCENDEQLSFQLNESHDSSSPKAVDKVKSLNLDTQEIKKECDHMILDRPTHPSHCSSDSELTVARNLNVSRCTSFQGTITSPWPPPIPKTTNDSENLPLSNFEKKTQERLTDDRVHQSDNTMNMHFKEGSDAHQHDYDTRCQEDKKLTSQYLVGYSSWGGSTSSEDAFDPKSNLFPCNDDFDPKSNVSPCNDDFDPKSNVSPCNDDFDPKSNVSPCNDDIIKYQYQSTDNVVPEVEPTSTKSGDPPNDGLKIVDNSQQSPSKWLVEFEDRRREIFILWDTCFVPLVHRTYFFLLFKGEPSDAVYMEVEQRRLSFLRSTLNRSSVRQASRALHHEREKLSKQIRKIFSKKERREMYQKWGIKVKSKKRRFQLCCRLWKYSHDIEHIKESAALIAKLVGLVEQSAAPEQIFGLSMPKLSQFKTHSRRRSLPSFRLV